MNVFEVSADKAISNLQMSDNTNSVSIEDFSAKLYIFIHL